MNNIRQIAERILGRPLQPSDGIAADVLVQAETKLGIRFPAGLRDFYLIVGNVPLLTEGHQTIYAPSDVRCDDMLVFMEEHQGVCLWGFKREELSEEDPKVYQGNPPEAPEWFCEEYTISEWWNVILYMQAVQGGYPHCGWLYEYAEAREQIEAEWEKVVDDGGLHIWWTEGKLVSFLEAGDQFDFLTGAARTRELLEELGDQFGFLLDNDRSDE